MISKSQYARVEVTEATASEPLSSEEVRASSAEYFGALGKFLGEELAGRAQDEYVRSIQESTEEAERLGGTDEDIQITRLR